MPNRKWRRRNGYRSFAAKPLSVDQGDVEEAGQEAFEVVVRPRLAGRIADERVAVLRADQARLDREGGVAARPVDLAADLHHAHALDGALPDVDEGARRGCCFGPCSAR